MWVMLSNNLSQNRSHTDITLGLSSTWTKQQNSRL